MKRVALILALLVLAVFAVAQAPDWEWANRAGGSQSDRGQAIGLDGSGNSYVTGSFSGTADFGAITLTGNGGPDVFIAKADPSGNWLWARSAGGPNVDEGYGIDVDLAGNCFVTGVFNGSVSFGATVLSSVENDIFVAQLDAAGNWIWASRAGGASADAGTDVIVGATGFLYLTGYFQGTASFGGTSLTSYGGEDVFLALLGAMGSFLAAVKAGGAENDRGQSLVRDALGNTYVTGFFSGTATFYTTVLTSSGSTDVFLAKFDPVATLVGVVRAGGIGADSGTDLAADSVGNVYLTGFFFGTADFGPFSLTSNGFVDIFVAKFQLSGLLEGVVKAGGTGFDEPGGIDVDSAGDVYLTGYYYGSASFGPQVLPWIGEEDLFVAKLAPTGDWLWAQRAGGAWDDIGAGIAVDSAGNSHVTGSFIISADFGTFPLVSNNMSQDIFLARLRYDPAKPLAPQNLSLSLNGPLYHLQWDPVTQDNYGDPVTIDHYQVYQAADPLGPYVPASGTSTLNWWEGVPGPPFEFFRVTAVAQE